MTTTPRQIAYFAHERDQAAYWGALAVLTSEGDPVDFFYTEPVVLSPIVRQLLGSRADAYVIERVLLKPLLAQAAGAADVVCLDDPVLLLRRFCSDRPAAVVAPPDAACLRGEWIFHDLGSAGEGCWLRAGGDGTALTALREAGEGLAPWGLADSFRQVRAAMAEVRAS